MRTIDEYMMKRCKLCGRRMFKSGTLLARVFRSRLDCGGDCWRCIREIEDS